MEALGLWSQSRANRFLGLSGGRIFSNHDDIMGRAWQILRHKHRGCYL